MTVPEFVPTAPTHQPRVYTSPPRREDEWLADRPAEIVEGGFPDRDAGRMGAPGPDQGYVLTLLPLLRDELHLTEHEKLADVERGAVAVALKRASLFGRAPIVHDLRVAYTLWGFLDPGAPAELVEERRRRFAGVRLVGHHYPELRAVADAVPEETLRRTPAEIADAHRQDWRSQLVLRDAVH